MKNLYLFLGSFSCFISTIIGAISSHYLKKILSENDYHSIEIAIRYQMYVGLSVILFATLFNFKFLIDKLGIIFLFLGGMIFSNSIYIIYISKYLFTLKVKKILFLLTPLGGILMIIGWLLIIIRILYFRIK